MLLLYVDGFSWSSAVSRITDGAKYPSTLIFSMRTFTWHIRRSWYQNRMHPVDRRLLARSMRREMKGLSKAIRLTMNTKTSVRAYYYILRTDIAINKQNSSSCFEHACMTFLMIRPLVLSSVVHTSLFVHPYVAYIWLLMPAHFRDDVNKTFKRKMPKIPRNIWRQIQELRCAMQGRRRFMAL